MKAGKALWLPVPLLSALLLGLGCSGSPATVMLPSLLIEVHDLPAGSATIDVAYSVSGQPDGGVPGVLAATQPTLPVTPAALFSFGLDLGGSLSGPASISIAARDANHCLLAVGISKQVTPGDGSTTAVYLSLPSPPQKDPVCDPQLPVILAAYRTQSGPLAGLVNTVQLQGWGFTPSSQVTMLSSAVLPNCTSTFCTNSCKPTVANPRSVTSCKPLYDLYFRGPGLLEMVLKQQPESVIGGTKGSPIDMLTLLQAPLSFTVQSDAATAQFTECLSLQGCP